MRTMSLEDVQAHLGEAVTYVEDNDERVAITRGGERTVVLISVGELNRLEETIEVLSDPDHA